MLVRTPRRLALDAQLPPTQIFDAVAVGLHRLDLLN
jgi:hypothetical protein